VNEDVGTAYYVSRAPEIRRVLDDHARQWHPFLVASYGREIARAIMRETRARHEALIPGLPYIGGDENRMTRFVIASTTGLALYLAMRARDAAPAEVGKILYDAVMDRMLHTAIAIARPLTMAEVQQKREEARRSQERRYPADWVWTFVEGEDPTIEYGYDFVHCATQVLYHAHGADAFLPYYCTLDFVTGGWNGWGFSRTTTLAEGGPVCDFRFRWGGETQRGWPPPFPSRRT
jgi:hypothetical protein